MMNVMINQTATGTALLPEPAARGEVSVQPTEGAPQLTIQNGGFYVALSWERTPELFTLEVSSQEGSPEQWFPVVDPPVRIGRNYTIILGPARRDRVFRLRRREAVGRFSRRALGLLAGRIGGAAEPPGTRGAS